MKAIRYILVVLVVSLSLISCEFEIDYKDELPKDKLVVTSFIQADSTISFSLYKSAIPGTYSDDYYSEWKGKKSSTIDAMVYDAKADLYINGVKKETLSQANNNSIYSFNTIPKENDKVEIRLNYKDYDQAIGKADLALIKPTVDSSNFSIETVTDEYGGTTNELIVYLEINDNGLGDNYYKIEPNFFMKTTNKYSYPISLSNADLLWENIQGVYEENTSSMTDESSNRYGIFSNKKFKGRIYKVKLSFNMGGEVYYDKKRKYTENVVGSFTVSSIEKQAYNYLYTLNKYLDNSSMNLEPVIIVDGIENAYGFIGAKNSLVIKNIDITL
jgi:hypothetical protein